MNMCYYRRIRRLYFSLSPRERVGMTPERLAALEAVATEGTNL